MLRKSIGVTYIGRIDKPMRVRCHPVTAHFLKVYTFTVHYGYTVVHYLWNQICTLKFQTTLQNGGTLNSVPYRALMDQYEHGNDHTLAGQEGTLRRSSRLKLICKFAKHNVEIAVAVCQQHY